MAAFMVLMFVLMMAVVGFVFDLYLYSRGEFGKRYVRNAKFTRSTASGPMLNCTDNYEFDVRYDRPVHNAGIMLIVLCAVFVVIMMVAIVVINFLA